MLLPDIFYNVEQYLGGDNAPPMLNYYKAVAEQSKPHTTRLLDSDSVAAMDDRRPHESKAIQEYRRKNRRQFTREVYEDFLSAVSRVMKSGDVSIKEESEALKNWLAEVNFEVGGKNYGLLDYARECILAESFRDPNQLMIAFPYNAENPGIAPALPESEGGLNPLQAVDIASKVISWEEIAFVNDDVLVFQGGFRLLNYNKQEVKQPFYYAADSEFWYIIEPEVVKDHQTYKIVYNLFVWYRHGTGESLVNFLPGQTEKTKRGFFLESFLRPAFEIGNEVIGRISDEQAIAVKYAHPIAAVYPTECKAQGCKNGYLNGNPKNTCGTCNGTGEVLMPGPYEVYRMPENNALDGDRNIKDPIRFIHPGTDIGQQAFSNWQTLIQMMKRSVGLDLLEGTANESGVAKQMRLDKLQDILSRVAASLFAGTLTNYLYQVESLLVPNPANRTRPTIAFPRTFRLDNSQGLKEAAETALAEDRFAKKMAYYQDQYRNSPETLRLKELAMCYAPLLLLTEDERTDGLNKGVYTKEDFIKAYNAEIALLKLNREGRITDNDEEVFGLMDQYMIDRGFMADPKPVSAPDNSAQAQGIVAINDAVISGRMTTAVAIRTLTQVFGFTEDVAQSLIESPVPAE